jgi:uncharacterized protein
MNKNKRLMGLVFLALLPMIIQLIVQSWNSYGLGLIIRIAVHILIPVLAVYYLTKLTVKESFLLPLKLKNKGETIKLSIIGGVGAIVIILGAFFIFNKGGLIDFEMMKLSLSEINVTNLTYPFVALAIVLVNPFLEEYFWRGFVFRVFDKYSSGYWTGLLFALHHTVMVMSWFNWWQLIIISVFLAGIGVLFNWTYKKTDSIYATLIVHTIADLVIVIIGFIMIF